MERGQIINKIKRVDEAIQYINTLPYSVKQKLWIEDLVDKKEFLMYLLYEWTVQNVEEE